MSDQEIRWPAEWEAQEAVWLSWPNNLSTWNKHLNEQWEAFTPLVQAITPHTPVWINIASDKIVTLEKFLKKQALDISQVRIHPVPTNDVWCRDHGATFVYNNRTKEREAVDFRFNAWGEKFPPWNLDDAVAAEMAKLLKIKTRTSKLILEGGAIEGNGAGTLITTEAVALNKNRNPKATKKDIELELTSLLGSLKIIWLPGGIEGDDTDGHIDDFCRFTDESTLLLAKAEKNSIDEKNLERAYQILASDESFDIIRLPMPDPIRTKDWRLPTLPASYANFLISNDLVLVPTFQQKKDSHALGMIKELFPKHIVRGLDARFFVQEGGAIHCLTQQLPQKK